MLPLHLPPTTTSSYTGHYPFVSSYVPWAVASSSSSSESPAITSPSVLSMRQLRETMALVNGPPASSSKRTATRDTFSARERAALDYLGAIVACRRHTTLPDDEGDEGDEGGGDAYLTPSGSRWHGAGAVIIINRLDVEHFLVVQHLCDIYATAGNARLAKRQFTEAASMFDAAAVFAGLSTRMLTDEDVSKQWPRSLRQQSIPDSRACLIILRALAAQSRLLHCMHGDDGGGDGGEKDRESAMKVVCRLAVGVHRLFLTVVTEATCDLILRDYADMHADYWMVRICVGLNIEQPCDGLYDAAHTTELTLYTARCAAGAKSATALARRMTAHHRDVSSSSSSSSSSIISPAFVTDASAVIQLLTTQRVTHDAMWARHSILSMEPYAALETFELDMTTLGAASVDDDARSQEAVHATAIQRHVGVVIARARQWVNRMGGTHALAAPMPRRTEENSLPLDVNQLLGREGGGGSSRNGGDKKKKTTKTTMNELRLSRRERLVAIGARLAERASWLAHRAHVQSLDEFERVVALRALDDVQRATDAWSQTWDIVNQREREGST